MRIALRQRQPPLLVQHNDHYRIYCIYTPDLASGTYYHLDPDGTVDLVTIKDREIVDIIRYSHKSFDIAVHQSDAIGEIRVFGWDMGSEEPISVVTTGDVVSDETVEGRAMAHRLKE